MSSLSPDTLTGASMLAAMLASQAKPGFTQNPGDYEPTRVQFSGAIFNDNSKYYRSDLDPACDFLVGEKTVGAEGVEVIVLGSLSGFEERDRVLVDGREEKRRFAIWKYEPKVECVKGRGGGKKTARGDWISGEFDEIFVLVNGELCVLSLYDQHHVVASQNRRAAALGVGGMYEIKWRLTKLPVKNGEGYTHYEPRFELLGVAGEPNGPTEIEIGQAKTFCAMIVPLSHPLPDVPLKLVVNGAAADEPWNEPIGEPFAPHPDDPGASEDSDVPF
jgi:hypothetical protein